MRSILDSQLGKTILLIYLYKKRIKSGSRWKIEKVVKLNDRINRQNGWEGMTGYFFPLCIYNLTDIIQPESRTFAQCNRYVHSETQSQSCVLINFVHVYRRYIVTQKKLITEFRHTEKNGGAQEVFLLEICFSCCVSTSFVSLLLNTTFTTTCLIRSFLYLFHPITDNLISYSKR